MRLLIVFFFFNDPATTEIYTLSLHDALPICPFPPAVYIGHPGWKSIGGRIGYSLATGVCIGLVCLLGLVALLLAVIPLVAVDRKSTRLNSSHANISYAVFCLKKKKKKHARIV